MAKSERDGEEITEISGNGRLQIHAYFFFFRKGLGMLFKDRAAKWRKIFFMFVRFDIFTV